MPQAHASSLTITPTVTLRNYSIDAFRLLGAIAVILLHVQYRGLPNEVVLLLRWFGRFAVPFFFMASGYFFQKNYAKQGGAAVMKSLLNLLPIALVANLIFILFKTSQAGGDLSEVFSLHLFTMSGHLWFLNALIGAYLMLWLLLERKADAWLLPLAHIIATFSLITNAYSLLLGLKTDKGFAMMILSLPFLIYGYKASQTDFVGKHISVWGAVLLIIGGLFLQTAEILFLYKYSGYSPHNQEFLLGSLFYAGGIFALALKLSMPHDTVLSEYGRKYSLTIYLYHPLIVAAVAYAMSRLPAAYLPVGLWLNPVLCVALTLLIIRVLSVKAPRVFRFLNGI